jgi:intein/homing endonuclease
MAIVPNPPVEIKWAWIAGVIEGDGCLTSKKGTLSIAVGMTDEDTIRRLHAWSGVGSVNGPYKQTGKGYKQMWYWNVGGAQQAKFVLDNTMYLFSSRRKARAEELLKTVRDNNYCSNNHEYTKENTYIVLNTIIRRCRSCRANCAGEFRARQRSKV